MNESIKKANLIKFETIVKNLENRNMEAFCCDTAEEACDKALSMIKRGASVGCGGSVTIREIGLLDKLAARGDAALESAKPPNPEEAYEHLRTIMMSDVFLTSANAITMDGKIVNIDARGNRVAAFICGPKEVIVIVGANKIVESEGKAIARIKTDACPPNAVRLGRKTSCAVTGHCSDCLFDQTMCCHTVVTRYNAMPGRIKVILVNENLGF